MSDFPWNSVVLFEGRFHAPMWLPIHYLPKLIGLQLTEPVLLLSAFGLCIAVLNAARKRAPEPLLLFSLWFLIPVAILVLRRTPMYDNFRQILFLLPPLFVLAGLTLDWLFGRRKNAYLQIAVIALVVLPGVRSLVALHPYQYIYYNSLQPGVHGVFREYELDYLATAYREAALFLNKAAPPAATVLVDAPATLLSPYSRRDLQLLEIGDPGNPPEGFENADYAVLGSRYNHDLTMCKDQEIVKTVERETAILVVVKEIGVGGTGCP
jgi:hypothetical protein